MGIDGHIDVMSCKTWAYWTLLVGFLLNIGVCTKTCYPFNDYVSLHVLEDHIFKFPVFHPSSPGSTKTKQEIGLEVLSVVNMLCSSWMLNKATLSQYRCESSGTENIERDSRKCVVESYESFLKSYLHNTNETITTLCGKYKCDYSYCTEYLDLKGFKEKYTNTCRWNEALPACPVTQSSPSTNPPPCACPGGSSPLTTTPSPSTSHQSRSASSASRLNQTDPPVTNGENDPLENKGSDNQTFQISDTLFILSAAINVVLLIVVWQQHRGRHWPPTQAHQEVPQQYNDLQQNMPLQGGNMELRTHHEVPQQYDDLQQPLQGGNMELRIQNEEGLSYEESSL